MSTPEDPLRRRDEDSLEPIPKDQQAINFAIVYELTSNTHGPTYVYRDRVQLLEAFMVAPNYPINFPAMSGIMPGTTDEFGFLVASSEYPSRIRERLADPEGEDAQTKWGLFQLTTENPYRVMRILQTEGVYSVLKNPDSCSLYAAQHKETGEVSYFSVVSQGNEGKKLKVIHPLDKSSEIAVAHEVRSAANFMRENVQNYLNLPQTINRIVQRYSQRSNQPPAQQPFWKRWRRRR